MTPHQARVLGLVVQGYRTAAELAKKLGVKRQVTQKTLGKLRAKGLVEQVGGARSAWRPVLRENFRPAKPGHVRLCGRAEVEVFEKGAPA